MSSAKKNRTKTTGKRNSVDGVKRSKLPASEEDQQPAVLRSQPKRSARASIVNYAESQSSNDSDDASSASG
jgi:hypothetical protein